MSDRKPGAAGDTDDRGPPDDFECTYCGTCFREWPGGCPDCGGIVVRVVDPRPVPDD